MVGGYPPDSMAAIEARIRSGKGNDCVPCFLPYFAEHNDTTFVLAVEKQFDSVVKVTKDATLRVKAPYYRQLVQAYLQLARRDSANALRLFITLPDSLCHACGLNELPTARLLEANGRDREALGLLNTLGVDNNAYVVMLTFERARVAERLGEKAIAIDGYLQVAESWAPGDSAFQPYVAASRAALKRLGGDNASRIKLGTP
jgi:hypothetical protein